MATEQQTSDATVDAASAGSAESLTVTDNRTGKTYELPIDGRHRARHGPAPDQGRPRTNSG